MSVMPMEYYESPEERRDRAWTEELLRASQEIECEACRWEIVRTGGVVGVCDEHRWPFSATS